MAIPVYLWLKDDGGADIKDPSFKKHDRLEQIELRYQKSPGPTKTATSFIPTHGTNTSCVE